MEPKQYRLSLTENYHLPVNGVDELLQENGVIKECWRPYIRSIERLGSEELERRHFEAERLFRDNGVTYNAYEKDVRAKRPWDLDPVPLILDGDEWVGIEQGLKQRCELLNFVLKDIFTDQKLVKEKLLPADLLYHHAGFMRQYHNLPSHHQQHALIRYASNMVRGADNKWWVISDLTQAPSGNGYALETRIAMARVFPNLLRYCQVQRLADYFRYVRDSLRQMSHNDDPLIVFLSPGPYSENYFEDAYLANYQGLTLVQGDDLTVRNNYLWLKTLEGMKRVDVVLRRVHDEFCDPLELRADSRLGVAGLLQVLRKGRVAMANALGSHLLESPAIMPFLDKICQRVFQQDLQLPSAATWWCGQPTECKYVLENLASLVIKPIDRKHQSILGWLLSKKELSKLRDQIKAQPHRYVGQQNIMYATIPTWLDQTLKPRHGFMRCFAFGGYDGYRVMPGGLTCVAPDEGVRIVSAQDGAINKDTWVVASEQFPLQPFRTMQERPQQNQRQLRILSSRAAENLFWVGRYAERAEFTARLLREVIVNYFNSVEVDDEQDSVTVFRCLYDVLCKFTLNTSSLQAFSSMPELHELEQWLLPMIQDPSESGSVAIQVQLLHNAAFHGRDLWSNETWRVLDEIYQDIFGTHIRPAKNLIQVLARIDQLLSSISAFTGLCSESMTQDHGWMMLDIGRRLERGINCCLLAKLALFNPTFVNIGDMMAESMLVVQDSVMSYRRLYRRHVNIRNTLDLLLAEQLNPRALVYQVSRLQSHLQQLPHSDKFRLTEEQKCVLDSFTRLRLFDFSVSVDAVNAEAFQQALEALLQNVQTNLESVSELIAQRYYVHTQSHSLPLIG